MNLLKCFLTNNACFQAGEIITPAGVMIHSTGANNPMLRRYVQPSAEDGNYSLLIEQLGDNPNNNDWNNTTRQVCVHAFVGKLADGSVAVVQTLPWDMRGWHAGSGRLGSANDTHISFEICEDGLTDRVYFNQVYAEAVQLTAHLCAAYGLDPLADGTVICHSEGYRRGIANNHGDVMHWFPRHGRTMDDFRADVAAVLTTEDTDDFAARMAQYRAALRDNDASPYSEEARRWAVENGLVLGGSDGEFNGMWEDFLTREQAVTLLYRFSRL